MESNHTVTFITQKMLKYWHSLTGYCLIAITPRLDSSSFCDLCVEISEDVTRLKYNLCIITKIHSFRQPTKKVPGPLGRGADRPLVQAVQVSGLISLAGAGENSGMKLGQMVRVKAFSLGKYHKNVLHFKTFWTLNLNFRNMKLSLTSLCTSASYN